MGKSLITALFFGAVLLPSLSAQATQPDYAAIRTAIYNNQIEPGYAHFAERAHVLEYETTVHCKNIHEAPDMLAIRTAFHDAMDAWQAVQHFRHGAVAMDDRHARLQFWPDKRGVTERHLRKLLAEPASPGLAQGIAGASVALQGFPALERLLFDDAPLSQHLVGGEKAVRCRVAEAITHNIAGIAAVLKAESGGTDGDAKIDIANTVNDLVTALEFIQSVKLKQPAGTKRPRPLQLENWLSGRSLKNVEVNIRALRELYKLLYADAPDDDPQHKLILDQFDEAEDAIRAMGENGKVLLSEELGPVRFRALAGTLASLRELIAESLPETLQVNLGFNNLDGD
ncbi:imelysin family protein [Thalassospiraceae bacterium LMO-JJ14]|nr:imelysin family protein [Thalassospiraceae bacterium LMO-JJ14]